MWRTLVGADQPTVLHLHLIPSHHVAHVPCFVMVSFRAHPYRLSFVVGRECALVCVLLCLSWVPRSVPCAFSSCCWLPWKVVEHHSEVIWRVPSRSAGNFQVDHGRVCSIARKLEMDIDGCKFSDFDLTDDDCIVATLCGRDRFVRLFHCMFHLEGQCRVKLEVVETVRFLLVR